MKCFNISLFFSEEESESSIASFAFGPESVGRREQDKENVLEQENATIQKTNFKVNTHMGIVKR